MNITELCRMWGIPVNKIEGGVGELSDGYHSFNSLYRQRCILFATLCNTFKDSAWKSKKHHKGDLCFGGGWFIVGVETPKGQYTYHYELADWDLFDVKELDVAPKFDGHTDKDVERLLSLTTIMPRYMGLTEAQENIKNFESSVNIETPEEEKEFYGNMG